MAVTTVSPTFELDLSEAFPTTVNTGPIFVGEKPSVSDAHHYAVKYDLPAIAGTITSLKVFIRISANFFSAGQLNVYQSLRTFTSSATWNTYNGTNSWTTAGASSSGNDRSSAVASVNTPVTINQFYSWDITSLGYVFTNPVYLLFFNTNLGTDSEVQISNNGDVTPANRPYIEITYDPSPAGGLLLLSDQ